MLKSKVLAAVLAACVAGLPVLHGYADELSEKQAEYDRVQQQMRDMEAQREEARRAADAASSRMEEVVSELRQLQIRLDEINARQAELDAAIADNQAKLAEEKANLERRMNIFKKRLRDIYINGQINYLDVLLGAKDFSDFSSRMFLLQKIISRDIAMLDAINKSMAEIEKRQEELDAQTKELDALRAELEVKRQEAEARREERAQLLYAAEEERSQVEGEYDRLAAISENIASMLRSLQKDLGLTCMFVGHGLGAVNYVSDRIAVMYLGKIVEIGPAQEVFHHPVHPYTRALIDAVPIADPKKREQKPLLTGEIGSSTNPPSGCRFHPRCPYATESCRQEVPELCSVFPGSSHLAACPYAIAQLAGGAPAYDAKMQQVVVEQKWR